MDYNDLTTEERTFVSRILSHMISESKELGVELGVAQDYIDHRDVMVRLILKNRKAKK